MVRIFGSVPWRLRSRVYWPNFEGLELVPTESESAERFEHIAGAVESAGVLDLGVSAGHGLTYVNVKRFKLLPLIEEYSIGHSIVARAVLVGFERAVREMIELVKDF